jgi:hypothetical protein
MSATKWEVGRWHIDHDIAPAHSFQLVQQLLAEHTIPQVRAYLTDYWNIITITDYKDCYL